MNEPPAAAAGRVLRLVIGEEDSTLTLEAAGPERSVFRWALGTRRLGPPGRLSDPPTALMLERAIDAIEDEIMPAARAKPGGEELVLSPAALFQRLASSPGSHTPPPRLTAEEVEQRFNEIAAVSQGRPASQSSMPTDAASTAVLLIVREVLHHFGLRGVVAGA
jgi:hypothetical protein